MRRVAVTGLGAVTPIGNDAASSWDAAVEGRSGIDFIRSYDASEQAVRIGAEVKDFNPSGLASPKEVRKLDRFVLFALRAAREAVDDARRDTPGSDLQVYYYLELNLVWDAISGKPRAANAILPTTRVDYVSYSAYDSLLPNPEQKLPEALDYLQSQIKPKDGISGKRVFIGEYGFPADRYTPQEQDNLSRRVMRARLEWGCPFVLYWEMYNDKVRDGRQRGFWLIDNEGRQTAGLFHAAEIL